MLRSNLFTSEKTINTFKYVTHTQSNTQRRVVVTGIGIVSAVGCTVESAWKNILNGYNT